MLKFKVLTSFFKDLVEFTFKIAIFQELKDHIRELQEPLVGHDCTRIKYSLLFLFLIFITVTTFITQLAVIRKCILIFSNIVFYAKFCPITISFLKQVSIIILVSILNLLALHKPPSPNHHKHHNPQQKTACTKHRPVKIITIFSYVKNMKISLFVDFLLSFHVQVFFIFRLKSKNNL